MSLGLVVLEKLFTRTPTPQSDDIKIKKLVKTWNNRYLTPLGKITVIKTNLISQSVHLLSSLPRLESFLKTLNTILYNFLWNRKPDKIRRSTTALSHMQGGMKMIKIHHFDKALKTSWIKSLLFNHLALNAFGNSISSWDALKAQTHLSFRLYLYTSPGDDFILMAPKRDLISWKYMLNNNNNNNLQI